MKEAYDGQLCGNKKSYLKNAAQNPITAPRFGVAFGFQHNAFTQYFCQAMVDDGAPAILPLQTDANVPSIVLVLF